MAWPQFRYDPQHTGRSDNSGGIYVCAYNEDEGCSYLYAFDTDGTLMWRFKAPYEGILYPPVVDIYGGIYFVDYNWYLYALKANGTLKWENKTIPFRPFTLATSGETIYAGSYDLNYDAPCLSALDSNGNKKWSYITNDFVYTPPTIASDRTIYFGDEDHWLYALNPCGTLKWKLQLDYKIYASPAIGSDGTIYVVGYDPDDNSIGRLFAIDSDGTIKWQVYIGQILGDSYLKLHMCPVVYQDTIYVVAHGELYAVDTNGTVKWRFNPMAYDADYGFVSSPAIGIDGTIYVTCAGYDFFALNPDGTLKWHIKRITDSSKFHSLSPSIDSNGNIYVEWNGDLVAVDPSGNTKWLFVPRDTVDSAPVISPVLPSPGSVVSNRCLSSDLTRARIAGKITVHRYAEKPY